ncbi:MAG: hypothetical protein IT340_19560 [Chloroflexi bacterium]|nr:hypothetical protein [Chloroflexota bacterium]
MSDLAERLDLLLARLRTAYDGIGHSSGRPYVYLVYPPDQERAMRRLVDESLTSDAHLRFHHFDLLPLTVRSLAGQEERRQQLLDNAATRDGTAQALVRLWARAVSRDIAAWLERPESLPASAGRPVVVMRGLAALHPLGNPTALMEAVAEQEPRDPRTGRMVPIVLLVPGVRPPQTSRCYHFLGLERLRLDFYRGEEA